MRAGSPLKLVSAHKRIGRARPGGDGRPRGDRTRHAAGCRLPHVADALNRTHSHNNITMDIPTILRIILFERLVVLRWHFERKVICDCKAWLRSRIHIRCFRNRSFGNITFFILHCKLTSVV